MLPVPAVATELLDLTGRWCRERSPQRHPWQHGTWVREGRHGRTGHDATLLLVAGTAGFGFGHGEVWAVHTAWSGDHVHLAERRPEAGESDVLGGGELLAPGEVRLGPGETYETPRALRGLVRRRAGRAQRRAAHPPAGPPRSTRARPAR